MKKLPCILFGMFLGIGLVLACGDDSLQPVDAADATVCDCPAAEPPIAARVMIVKNDVVIPAMGISVNSAGCAMPGSILLSGSCDLPGNNLDVILRVSGFSSESNNDWSCQWTNNNVAPVNAQVLAKCLVP